MTKDNESNQVTKMSTKKVIILSSVVLTVIGIGIMSYFPITNMIHKMDLEKQQQRIQEIKDSNKNQESLAMADDYAWNFFQFIYDNGIDECIDGNCHFISNAKVGDIPYQKKIHSWENFETVAHGFIMNSDYYP